MCCKRVYLIAFVSFLIFTIVNGSCLEYGHSCWGAHGKRSGDGGGKLLRAAANIRNSEIDGNAPMPSNKALLEGIEELNNQPEGNGIVHLTEDDTGEMTDFNPRDIPKLKNFLRKHQIKLRNRNSLTDESTERDDGFKGRWRKFPILNLRPLTKSQMTKSENELLHQPSKSMIMDESLYYDIQ